MLISDNFSNPFNVLCKLLYGGCVLMGNNKLSLKITDNFYKSYRIYLLYIYI